MLHCYSRKVRASILRTIFQVYGQRVTDGNWFGEEIRDMSTFPSWKKRGIQSLLAALLFRPRSKEVSLVGHTGFDALLVLSPHRHAMLFRVWRNKLLLSLSIEIISTFNYDRWTLLRRCYPISFPPC